MPSCAKNPVNKWNAISTLVKFFYRWSTKLSFSIKRLQGCKTPFLTTYGELVTNQR